MSHFYQISQYTLPRISGQVRQRLLRRPCNGRQLSFCQCAPLKLFTPYITLDEYRSQSVDRQKGKFPIKFSPSCSLYGCKGVSASLRPDAQSFESWTLEDVTMN